MEWAFDIDGPVEADVVVPAGRVEVADGPEGRVLVVIEPEGGSSRRAAELLAATEVSCGSGKLRVHVPGRKFHTIDVDCRIRVPAGSSVKATTASADVACSVPLAALAVATASGDVELAEVAADLSFRSASGDLRCAAVGGALRVKGASGDIVVGRVGGKVDVALASGEVRIDDAAASLVARTASGDIRVGRAHAGRVKADTASGDITVGVAAGVGAYLDAMSVSGTMSCALPLEDRAAGDAALEIVCRSVNGDVTIEAAA